MGSAFSHLVPCLNPSGHHHTPEQDDVIFSPSDPLDETLGHSFCYVRSSTRFLSPTPSDRFLSHSFRFSPSREPPPEPAGKGKPPNDAVLGGFRAISGASVSANTSTPRTVINLDNIYDDSTESALKGSLVDGFDCTSSFCALPLQPVPRGYAAGDSERGFFMSGPIELGAMSGPLEPNCGGDCNGVPFSAPIGDMYMKKKRRKKGIPNFRRAFSRSSSQKKRPWVVPERQFIGRKEVEEANSEEKNVQWALGKAGEDRVHVVVSEELGWLFVGIYDGFNGPDAPEFLMGNLYKAVYKELEGLFWDSEDNNARNVGDNAQNVVADRTSDCPEVVRNDGDNGNGDHVRIIKNLSSSASECSRGTVKKVTFQPEPTETRRRRLWEFLAEDHPDEGLDLSGSDRYAFSVDDAVIVSNAGSDVSKRSLLLSKLKHGFIKHKDKKLFPWRFGLEAKEKAEVESKVEERTSKSVRQRKIGPVDHASVLGAMSRALEITELAYLDMTDRVLDQYPELALMGSCLLAVLMRDEDVYVMNLGDSRAIVARYSPEDLSTSSGSQRQMENGLVVEDTVEEARSADETAIKVENEACSGAIGSTALQLSTDHSTSIEEEIIRIKKEHPDDNHCIVNDRVKGRLKVTRAFGAGFLKRPKLNDSLLEMFRNEYIGTAPYISCVPSLCHHKLCPRDQFLVLSSDGLYQYFSNQEVVSYVENFMEKFPDGDPAQHLIEELLLRAAKKAGMDLHELLDIPQGDRRKYHDDVTVMVISLEGRIWKSSGKYL